MGLSVKVRSGLPTHPKPLVGKPNVLFPSDRWHEIPDPLSGKKFTVTKSLRLRLVARNSGLLLAGSTTPLFAFSKSKEFEQGLTGWGNLI